MNCTLSLTLVDRKAKDKDEKRVPNGRWRRVQLQCLIQCGAISCAIASCNNCSSRLFAPHYFAYLAPDRPRIARRKSDTIIIHSDAHINALWCAVPSGGSISTGISLKLVESIIVTMQRKQRIGHPGPL
ncbi:hypothetical protein ZHAS_00021061 [Anopheles sinensis]|uniref:Uncharacterized protein n=1 Tax=Anopheles sinensis TaxID=74873 RepID=A0A084WRF0_ANOSI|nr:hypothetical protein ZHAS_00021061 [Anopheles sinensis]